MLQTWTVDRVEELKKLYADGMTCREIAFEMGMTRNMVIGKINRLGLSSPKVAKLPARLVAQRSSRANAGPQVQAINARREAPDTKAEPFAMGSADVQPLHVDIADLTATTCRWPYGDGAPFTFCGCVVLKGKPYCSAHLALSRSGVIYAGPSQRFSEEHRRRLSEAQKARHARERGAAA